MPWKNQDPALRNKCDVFAKDEAAWNMAQLLGLLPEGYEHEFDLLAQDVSWLESCTPTVADVIMLRSTYDHMLERGRRLGGNPDLEAFLELVVEQLGTLLERSGQKRDVAL